MRYVHLAIDQIPVGQAALILFIRDYKLCAGIVEHRCDGRFVRQDSDPFLDDSVIPMIRKIFGHYVATVLYVVIEKDAFWPDQFPKLVAWGHSEND